MGTEGNSVSLRPRGNPVTDNEDIKNGSNPPTDGGVQPNQHGHGFAGDSFNVVRPTGDAADPLQKIDVSQSGHWLRDQDSGEVCPNPLDIDDQTKRDNVNVMQRTTTVWAAHAAFISILYTILLGQLLFTPAKIITVPVEVWGIIVGIYAGSSTNVIGKLLEMKDRFKRKD